MSNEFYDSTGVPTTGSSVASLPIRAQFALIEDAFDLFPNMTGNAGRVWIVNSNGNAITLTTGALALAGSFTVTGGHSVTLTTTATTSVTLPTAGTLATLAGAETLENKTLTAPVLVNAALGTPASGTLTNCTGNATGLTAGNVSGVVAGANGGTGVANTGSTITIGGNVTFSGAFTFTATLSNNTSVTFPTSGTLLSTATAVTVAQGGTGVASFTAYGVIIGGTTATGALQSVALGTAGQVLTSNGPGAAPTMQNTVASAMVLLNTLTASSSASLIDTTSITSAYDLYMIVYDNITSASASRFRMEASVDGGSSYLGSVYYNQWLTATSTTVAATSVSADTTMDLLYASGASVPSTSGIGLRGVMWLNGPNLGVAKAVNWIISRGGSGTGPFSSWGYSNINTASAINALKWTCASGNISTGTIRIYGVKTS